MDEILDRIKQLEKEKMEYLEVNDKRTANRKQKEIDRLQSEIELKEARKMAEQVKSLKKFIAYKGLNLEYANFIEREENKW